MAQATRNRAATRSAAAKSKGGDAAGSTRRDAPGRANGRDASDRDKGRGKHRATTQGGAQGQARGQARGQAGGQAGGEAGGEARGTTGGTARGQARATTRPRKPKPASQATFDYERRGHAAGHAVIAGVDEAGRGPWAGPVVAAAVVLDPDALPPGIADSKALTHGCREALFDEICSHAQVGIAFADAERIDRDNILAATLWAMQRAVAELPSAPGLVLVDGNRAPALPCVVETIVKGDALSLSIAAASIVAKVSRDRMMARLDVQYPGYGFAQHKGYGTAQHSAALAANGVTPLHRRSFKPVRAILDATPGAG